MTQMLELSDRDFKITMIHVKSSNGKADNMQEEMGNIRREMGMLRKNQEGMLEINTVA